MLPKPYAYVDAFLALPGVVGLWPLWEQDDMGTTYRDLGKNGLHLTKQGTHLPTYLHGTSVGLLGNGTSGNLARANEAAFDVGDSFALVAVVVPGAGGSNRGLVSRGGGGGTGGAYMRLKSANTLNILASNKVDICTSTVALAANRASHCVATKSGGTTKLYINGADVTGTVNAGTCDNTTVGFRVGSDRNTVPADTEFHNGRIAMVGMLNRLMTPQEAYHLARLAFGN